MNVLITGGTGLLGSTLQQQAPSVASIHSIYHPSEQPLNQSLPYPNTAADITDQATITGIFKQTLPDVVIHTAAQGSLDWCEENPDQARQINVDGSKNVAGSAEQYHAHFIFLSSNAVYDGKKGNYSETDPINPVNVYGQTKVDIEQWLPTTNLSYTIVRPNLMYGWPRNLDRGNQVTRVISSLRQGEPANGVTNTYFTPLAVRQAAEVIWQIAQEKLLGTFNLGSAERLTLFELSEQTASVFGLDAKLIKPVQVADSPATARRAIDTSFNTTKMTQTFGAPPSIKDELQLMQQHEPVNAHPHPH